MRRASLREREYFFFFFFRNFSGNLRLGCMLVYSLKINIFHFWGCRMNYYWDEHCGEIEGLVWGITHLKTFTRTFTSFPSELTRQTRISISLTNVRAHITLCLEDYISINKQLGFLRSFWILAFSLKARPRGSGLSDSLKVLVLGWLGKTAIFNERVRRMPSV